MSPVDELRALIREHKKAYAGGMRPLSTDSRAVDKTAEAFKAIAKTAATWGFSTPEKFTSECVAFADFIITDVMSLLHDDPLYVMLVVLRAVRFAGTLENDNFKTCRTTPATLLEIDSAVTAITNRWPGEAPQVTVNFLLKQRVKPELDKFFNLFEEQFSTTAIIILLRGGREGDEGRLTFALLIALTDMHVVRDKGSHLRWPEYALALRHNVVLHSAVAGAAVRPLESYPFAGVVAQCPPLAPAMWWTLVTKLTNLEPAVGGEGPWTLLPVAAEQLHKLLGATSTPLPRDPLELRQALKKVTRLPAEAPTGEKVLAALGWVDLLLQLQPSLAEAREPPFTTVVNQLLLLRIADEIGVDQTLAGVPIERIAQLENSTIAYCREQLVGSTLPDKLHMLPPQLITQRLLQEIPGPLSLDLVRENSRLQLLGRFLDGPVAQSLSRAAWNDALFLCPRTWVLSANRSRALLNMWVSDDFAMSVAQAVAFPLLAQTFLVSAEAILETQPRERLQEVVNGLMIELLRDIRLLETVQRSDVFWRVVVDNEEHFLRQTTENGSLGRFPLPYELLVSAFARACIVRASAGEHGKMVRQICDFLGAVQGKQKRITLVSLQLYLHAIEWVVASGYGGAGFVDPSRCDRLLGLQGSAKEAASRPGSPYFLAAKTYVERAKEVLQPMELLEERIRTKQCAPAEIEPNLAQIEQLFQRHWYREQPNLRDYLAVHKELVKAYQTARTAFACLRRLQCPVDDLPDQDFYRTPLGELEVRVEQCNRILGLSDECWKWLVFFAEHESRLFTVFMTQKLRGVQRSKGGPPAPGTGNTMNPALQSALTEALTHTAGQFRNLLAPKLQVNDLIVLYDEIKKQGNFGTEIGIAAEFLRTFAGDSSVARPGNPPVNATSADARLKLFDDAMKLLQLRQEAQYVPRFLRVFDLFPEDLGGIELVCTELQTIREIEVLKSAEMLKQWRTRLHGLAAWMAAYMSQLSLTPNAKELFAFFLEHADFAHTLNVIYDNSQGNEDALELIDHVKAVFDAVRPVLSFLKARGTSRRFADLVTELQQLATEYVGAVQQRSADSSSVEGGYLLQGVSFAPDVTQRLAEIRGHFERTLLDSSDNVGALISGYLDHGVMTSYLARSEYGSALVFTERRPAKGGLPATENTVSEAYLRDLVHGLALYEGSSQRTESIGNRVSSTKLALFCEVYRATNQIHELRLRLEAAGHPGCQKEDAHKYEMRLHGDDSCRRTLGEKIDELSQYEREWHEVVRIAQQKYPRLLFLEPRQLSRMLEILLALPVAIQPNRETACANSLLPFVRACFADHCCGTHQVEGKGRVHWVDESDVTAALRKSRQPRELIPGEALLRQYEAQLEVAGPLLGAVEEILDASCSDPISVETEARKVSVLLMADCSEADIFHALLRCIDGSTPLPGPFLLNCRDLRSALSIGDFQIRSFLERAKIFPTLPCAIVGVENLDSKVRATMLQWLNENREENLGPITLIFTGKQGSDAFIAFNPEKCTPGFSDTSQAESRECVRDRLQRRGVAKFLCVHGEPRTGKTYFINKAMEDLRSSGVPCSRVSINEDFTPRSALAALSSSLSSAPQPAPGLALHFNCSAYCEYVAFAGFLYDALLFGLVSDHDSGELALWPELALYLFVELTPAPATESGGREQFYNTQNAILAMPVVHLGSSVVSSYSRPLASLIVSDPLFLVLRRAYNWIRKWRTGGLSLLNVEQCLGEAPLTDDEVELERDSVFQNVFARYNVSVPRLPADRRSFELLLADRFDFLFKYYEYAQLHAQQDGITLRHLGQAGGVQAPEELVERFLCESARLCQRPLQARVTHTELLLSVRQCGIIGDMPYIELINFTLERRGVVDDDDFQLPNVGEVDDWVYAQLLQAQELRQAERFREKKGQRNTAQLAYREACVDSARLRIALGPLLGIRNTSIVSDLLREAEYLLTPDALIKNVLLHEKRRSGQNAVVVGDTGLGKTMLLRLLSLLMNADSRIFPNRRQLLFDWLKQKLGSPDPNLPQRPKFAQLNFDLRDSEESLLEVAREMFRTPLNPELPPDASVPADQQLWVEFRTPLLEWIQTVLYQFPLVRRTGRLLVVCNQRQIHPPPIVPQGTQLLTDAEIAPTDDSLVEILQEFLRSGHCDLWMPLLMSPRISKTSFRSFVRAVVEKATSVKQLTQSDVTVIAFVDEFNTTTSLMGSIKEIFCDNSFDGEALPTNIFWVAAMNPQSTRHSGDGPVQPAQSHNSADLDFTGVQGSQLEFIVRPAPLSMQHLELDFGQLDHEQEKQFTHELLSRHPPPEGHPLPASLVDFAQQFLRDAHLSRIHISLRDVVRVHKLHRFFTLNGSGRNCGMQFLLASELKNRDGFMRWMPVLLALALGYYFRLPEKHAKGCTRLAFAEAINRQLQFTSCPDALRREGFVKLVQSCLLGLFRQTRVPPGTAPTQALLENIFAISVCSQLPLPLLIVGPPGCSKTLAFTIVMNNMRGLDSSSPLFQKMLPMWSSRYQCSEQSTDAEIKTIYDNAFHKQQKDPNIAAVVFMDEAGLTPEEEMPLKAIHYELDKGGICSVLLSNKALDAAKTNRTLQLIHGPPSTNDISQLAWCCLYGDVRQNDPVGECTIDALRNGFLGVCRHTAHGSFELRDFIHFLRQIRDGGTQAPGNVELTPMLVAKSLQTNFGGGSHASFLENVAHPFLGGVAEVHPELASLVEIALSELKDATPALLKECIDRKLKDNEDPNASAIRNVMIIDPTDSGTALQHLFELELLDPAECSVMHIAAFQEDATETARGAAVARVKRAMALGETIILLNSLSIQSSFYDVFNRHFRKVESRGGQEVAYFANVAIGSLSTSCRVHTNFRVIVIFPESQLPVIPLPLRSRFARFRLSATHVLEQRLLRGSSQGRNYPHIFTGKGNENMLLLLGQAATDMIQQLHGVSCDGQLLYGCHLTETVASFLVRVDTATLNTEEIIVPQPVRVAAELIEEDPLSIPNEEAAADEVSVMLARFRNFVRDINFHLLMAARPERLFKCRNLPEAYVRELIREQEHFALTRFVPALYRQILTSESTAVSRKWVIFSRSSEEFHRLPRSERLQAALVGPSVPDVASMVCCISLGAVETAQKCCEIVTDFYRSPLKRVLLVVIDAASSHRSQYACLRYLVDQSERETRSANVAHNESSPNKSVILLVHLPPEHLFTTHSHTEYTGGWDFAYVDTFGARLSEQGLGEDVGDDVSLVPEADVRSWIQRAYGDRTVEVPVQSLYTAFRPVVMSILRRHCRSIRSHTFNSVAKQLSEAGKEVFTVRNNAFRGLERHIFDRWP
eukprot:TRINITY_DN3101_c0_g1_i1.p1 TRINITY_DN3101_c0_g1~~TRINITY_DN3101_c0_g1_i1.p1  ORF type:complete len:3317 (+),score=464.94 TRINITY_DN3101_c0_g1_i1:26-9952(+)